MRRIKIYQGVMTKVLEDGSTQTLVTEPFTSERDALNWTRHMVGSCKVLEDQWKPGIKNVTSYTEGHVIDVDEFDEHQPTYEVEISVTTTKTFMVEVEADDEYEADEKVRSNWENGEYDDDLRYIDPDDTEIDIISTEES
jgi:hypothetical protein